MDQSQSRTIRYAVAGFCILALLMLFGWLILRKSPPSSEPPLVRVVNVSPRARSVDPLFTPADEAPRETLTSQVAGSETTDTNAATIYRQAFAMYDALSNEEQNLIVRWRTNVDSSVEAELCKKIQPICDLLHQAAAVTNCDWGLEQSNTFAVPAHLSPCRNLARAAIWSVAHCRTGTPSAAVDDLVAASRLGQKVSSSTVNGHLLDLAIQGMVIDSVTEHASTLVGAGDTRLVELLKYANYDDGLRHAFEQEADMVTREADRLAAMPPEEAMRELIQLADSHSLEFQSMGLAQAIADIRQVADVVRQYAQALELPEAEYHAWLASLDEAGKTNPLVDRVISLQMVVIMTQAMTVRSAMAAAGLAVMQSGPDALQSHPDPSTGQPFAYTKTADGFELQSSFQFQEKPVKLSFR